MSDLTIKEDKKNISVIKQGTLTINYTASSGIAYAYLTGVYPSPNIIVEGWWKKDTETTLYPIGSYRWNIISNIMNEHVYWQLGTEPTYKLVLDVDNDSDDYASNMTITIYYTVLEVT